MQSTSKLPQPFIAAVIRLLRTQAGLTQEQLALEVGVKPSEISHLESGRRNPKLGTLQRLAEVLEVRCSYMLWLAEELEATMGM
ncbi:MAG: helix-turn-helix domain-containing protein [Solirubrobacterales bacterium]